MLKQITQFILRWVANCLGLTICSYINIITISSELLLLVAGGVLLAVLNALIKPVLVIISLPLISYTLGFFLVVINGLVVYLLSLIYPPLEINNFWFAMVAGIIIGLVNYIVTITYERFVSNE